MKNIRNHACTYAQCTRVFKKLDNLRQHERTHTGEMPYACGICGKMFRQNGSLYNHLKTHKSQDESKCYSRRCINKFRNSGQLYCETHKLILGPLENNCIDTQNYASSSPSVSETTTDEVFSYQNISVTSEIMEKNDANVTDCYYVNWKKELKFNPIELVTKEVCYVNANLKENESVQVVERSNPTEISEEVRQFLLQALFDDLDL
mmetsp:Transcript_12830/g.19275  ORF Transcript_12830/g.19275 Transcript_12830/m.19275 type:complete len:206 (+) Transcript_12830:34-651(+)